MNFRHLTGFCVGILLAASCADDVTEVVTYDASKDAQIYAFSVAATFYNSSDSTDAGKAIRAKDSTDAANITAARFAIDQLRNIIYNPDSLPYGTTPKKVMMTVEYNATSGIGQFEIFVPDSAKYYIWNSSDSVDFSQMPVYFRLTAPNGYTTKDYRLDLRIHQIDPDTIIWQRQPDFETLSGKPNVLLHGNTFYAYSSNGLSTLLYTADKASLAWTPQSLQGLPSDLLLESITMMNNAFFAIDNTGNSYTSPDGVSWMQQTNGETVRAIYGVIPAYQDSVLLLAIEKNDGKRYFGTTSDLTSIAPVDKVSAFPNDPAIQPSFPVKGFSSVTNYNRERQNYNLLIVTAGINNRGEELNTTWLIHKTAEGLEMTPSSRNSVFQGAGISTFLYDSNLYAFAPIGLCYSTTWGDRWTTAPDKQQSPEAMPQRTHQSVVADNENYIWIFGGISESGETLKDVWKGRLNRLAR
ncbi:MAG: DUF6242 domain-containing protein [Prevotella sp.]|jgi:hypothetical protein|nr:DUF6242 domain-containing protein [Prevotella sp.]